MWLLYVAENGRNYGWNSKKLKAIKKRLRRMVSKTPSASFITAFSKYCRLRPKWVLIESFHGQTVSDSGLVLAQEIARLYPGQYRVFYATEDKRSTKPLWTRRDCKWSWWM